MISSVIRNFRIYFIFVCQLYCYATSVHANGDTNYLSNSYSLHNWNTEDQLPQSSVNTIIQSADGYLWLGTFGGIAKFDGVSFEHIKHPALIYERVISLFEDEQGYIWIGTENNGLFRYKDDEVKHYHLSNGFPGVGITSIFQYGTQVGVLIQGKGIAIISGDDVAFTSYDILDGELLEQAIVDQDQKIWIVSSEGMFLMENMSSPPKFIKNSYHEEDGLSVFENENDEVIFGNQDGFFRVNKEKLEAEFLFDHQVDFLSRQLLIRDNGDFWYGGKGNEIHCLSNNERLKWGRSEGIPNGEVSCIYEDQSGNVWVGLNGGGLVEFYKNQVNVLAKNTVLSEKIFLAIHDDQLGKLWMATNNGGFFMLEIATQQITELTEENNGISADIWSLASNSRGEVWGGTFGSGIFHLNPEVSDRFELIRDWGGKSQVILAMMYDTVYDRLLIGSDHGGVFQYRNSQWSNIIPDSLSQDRITKFTLSPNGDVFVSTQGNGLKVIRDTDVTYLNKENGLPSNSIRDVFFDSKGTMWLGSYGNGIIVKQKDKFIAVGSKKGLFSDLISTIREDHLGDLWMSCNSGVFRVKRKDLLQVANQEKETVQCQVFNKSHGMGHSETNGGFQSSSVQFPDGTLLYPTMKGVAVFDPKKMTNSDVITQIVISKITYGDTVLYAQNEIQIPAEYRDVEFTYSAPTFFAPELLTFEYILEGYDVKWNSSGTIRKVKYHKLEPGTYHFKVRARNSQGILSEEFETQKITVQPYFYETDLFKWILGLGGVLLILSVYGWQIFSSNRREEKLKRLVQERTKDVEAEKKITEEALQKVEEQSIEIQKMSTAKADFFQNISHELKTPLTLIKGPVEALLEANDQELKGSVREDLTLVKKQANYLSELITQLIDIARSEDGYLKKQEQQINILTLTQRVVSSVESWIQQKEINFQSNINLSRVEGVTDLDFVEKIIRNLLTNAIKFTPPEGGVSIALKEHGQNIIIVVSDSGSGIEEANLPHIFKKYFTSGNTNNDNASGTGIGLALVKEFIELLEGTIEVETLIGQGTTFTCTIPFFRTDESEISGNVPTELILNKDGFSHSMEESLQTETKNKPIILVVDDHEDIRGFIRKSLQNHFRVIEAHNGKEGVRKAQEILPDIIISDVNMPELDGLGLLNELKTNPNTDFIPILLLTARGSDKIKVQGWIEGADGYMAKPFNSKELLARVNGILENRKKLRNKIKQEWSVYEENDVNKTPFELQFEKTVHQQLTNAEFSFNESLDEFAMSLSKFQNLVKQHYQVTPQVYLRKKRLELAKSLIQKDIGTISEIAYASGFNSVSYFNRSFKKEYTITPSDLKSNSV